MVIFKSKNQQLAVALLEKCGYFCHEMLFEDGRNPLYLGSAWTSFYLVLSVICYDLLFIEAQRRLIWSHESLGSITVTPSKFF